MHAAAVYMARHSGLHALLTPEVVDAWTGRVLVPGGATALSVAVADNGLEAVAKVQ